LPVHLLDDQGIGHGSAEWAKWWSLEPGVSEDVQQQGHTTSSHLKPQGPCVTVQNVQCCLWLLLVTGKLGGITFLLLPSSPLELNYCLRCSTRGMHLRIGMCTCMHLNGSTTLQMSKK
jgi:hypothetical protein